jgi:hypothetical protein
LSDKSLFNVLKKVVNFQLPLLADYNKGFEADSIFGRTQSHQVTYPDNVEY